MLRDFTYIDDVTSCIEKMLFCPPKPDETGAPNAVYNIGNQRPSNSPLHRRHRSALGKPRRSTLCRCRQGLEKTYAIIEETQRDLL
jgi:nucleoside-diphosphate-sugar epimerase